MSRLGACSVRSACVCVCLYRRHRHRRGLTDIRINILWYLWPNYASTQSTHIFVCAFDAVLRISGERVWFSLSWLRFHHKFLNIWICLRVIALPHWFSFVGNVRMHTAYTSPSNGRAALLASRIMPHAFKWFGNFWMFLRIVHRRPEPK